MEKRVQVGELRASSDGSKMKVSGIAARYGVLSHYLGNANGKFKERIAPGAFKRILAANTDTVLNVNHDMSLVLGRTTAGTLRLTDTDKGLAFDCDLPDVGYARDLYTLVKRGDMPQCSFQFSLDEGDQSWGEEDDADGRVLVRTIRGFKQLDDVSIVAFGAYPGTAAIARNLVPTEVRSRAERIGRVSVIAAKYKALCEREGVTNEVSYEQVQRRRQELLRFVLD
jgi:HK97 family phage prohead protease